MSTMLSEGLLVTRNESGNRTDLELCYRGIEVASLELEAPSGKRDYTSESDAQECPAQSTWEGCWTLAWCHGGNIPRRTASQSRRSASTGSVPCESSLSRKREKWWLHLSDVLSQSSSRTVHSAMSIGADSNRRNVAGRSFLLVLLLLLTLVVVVRLLIVALDLRVVYQRWEEESVHVNSQPTRNSDMEGHGTEDRPADSFLSPFHLPWCSSCWTLASSAAISLSQFFEAS